MAFTPQASESTTAGFDRVLAVIDGSRATGTLPSDAREAARANALALLRACDGSPDAPGLALLAFAAELLSAIAVDLAANPAGASRLIDRLQSEAGLPRVALARELLRSGRLLELGVEVAIEVQLALLVGFTGVRAVSLWTLDGAGEPHHVAHAGELERKSRHTLAAVRSVFADRAPADRGGAGDTSEASEASDGEPVVGLRVDALRPPAAALVAHGDGASGAQPGPLLAAAAPVLAVLLEREAVQGREQSQESLAGAVERRLARLRFDLHDGPQQDVHLLAQDLRLFRDQLRPMIAGDPDEARVLGRLDDLEAQLVALDGDLRRLSSSVQSPLLTPRSLEEALAQLTDAFAERTGIVPATTCSGELSELSDSQQIALLSLIREALSNIRKHSDAEHVSIDVAAAPGGIHIEIADDGSGFDPETTLVRAARAGHLGLVGMHERVRMLGGRTQIDSQPGGPTVISATLPPWPGPGR